MVHGAAWHCLLALGCTRTFGGAEEQSITLGQAGELGWGSCQKMLKGGSAAWTTKRGAADVYTRINAAVSTVLPNSLPENPCSASARASENITLPVIFTGAPEWSVGSRSMWMEPRSLQICQQGWPRCLPSG